MKNATKTKLITALIFLLLIAAIVAALKGGVTASASVESDVYYGDSFITADVNENKIIHVTEKLEVGFAGEAELYGRQIPAIGQTGGGRRFIIKVENLTAHADGALVNSYCSREGSVNFLRVNGVDGGNFSRWTEENQLTYEIKLEYDLNMSEDIDGTAALDFVFFGSYTAGSFVKKGDGSYSKLNVTVNMPKAFDAEKAAVISGGRDVSEEFALKVSGNTITFATVFSRADESALKVELPNDYFSAKLTQYGFYWVFVVLFAIIVAVGVYYIIKYRPRKPLVTLEFEPPLLNPMHFSAFWHGYARRRDICTVILHWANSGCVKIKKDGRRDLIITKVKDLPEGATAAEKSYFKALFEEGGVYRSAEMKGKAKRGHRNSIRYAAGKLIDEFGEPVTYAKGVERARFFVRYIPVFTLIVLFLYFIVLTRFYAGITFLFMATVALIGFMKVIYTFTDETKGMRHRRLVVLGLSVGFGSAFPAALGIVLYFAAAEMFLPMYDYIYLTYIAVAWIVLSVTALPKFIGKRTDEAQKLYGKMVGFKNFLQRAEVRQMEALLEENPEYYLNVLPYCMIMGLSKKLDKKTEFLQSPDWADGFEAKKFASSLCSAVKHSVITRKKKVKNYEEK